MTTTTGILALWSCPRCGWVGTWRGCDPKADSWGETTTPTTTELPVKKGVDGIDRIKVGRCQPDRCPECRHAVKYTDRNVASAQAERERRRGNRHEDAATATGTDDI